MTDFLINKFASKETDSITEKRALFGRLSGLVGIGLNFVLFLIKLTAGILSGSISIMADSFNNLSDAGSSVVTILGFKIAELPPDENHPYGHGRVEYLSGLFISVFIFLVGAELLKNGMEKIFLPVSISFTHLTFTILFISILAKIWLCIFNKKLYEKTGSAPIKASSLDSRNDAVITSSVLLSSLFTRFTDINIDGYVAVVISVFIFISGIGIMKDTINPLLGQAPDKELLKEISEKVLSTKGILGMHDFIVHDYGPGRKFATLHAEMDCNTPPMEAHEIIDSIERRIKKETGVNLVIHYDPVVLDDPLINNIKQIITDNLREMDESLTMHDLRMVKGYDKTSWIFDIVVPLSLNMTTKDIVNKLEERIKYEDPSYEAVITVDQDYTNDFN